MVYKGILFLYTQVCKDLCVAIGETGYILRIVKTIEIFLMVWKRMPTSVTGLRILISLGLGLDHLGLKIVLRSFFNLFHILYLYFVHGVF